jgi:hypothetical protein
MGRGGHTRPFLLLEEGVTMDVTPCGILILVYNVYVALLLLSYKNSQRKLQYIYIYIYIYRKMLDLQH